MSSGVIPVDRKTAADRRVMEAALRFRALDYEGYTELCTALFHWKEYYRDRAIDGAVDNGLSIGFARGATEIQKLIADASTLLAETTKR